MSRKGYFSLLAVACGASRWVTCEVQIADAKVPGVTGERFEVQRHIAAPPEAVFDLLCDPQGHVAIDSSGMLQSAEGQKVRQAGDTFVVHMDREARNDYPMGKYDVTVIITRYEENSLIEWTISGTIQPPMKHLYGYRIEPTSDGCLVTSYYDWSQIEEQYRGLGVFPVIPDATLRATLGILARTVERPVASRARPSEGDSSHSV